MIQLNIRCSAINYFLMSIKHVKHCQGVSVRITIQYLLLTLFITTKNLKVGKE